MKSSFNTRICLFLLVISALFTGISYAHNKIVVIPLGVEPSANIDALLDRIALETKLACVDAQSNASSFELKGCAVSFESIQGIVLQSAASTLTLRGSDASINTAGLITLRAALIESGPSPVARQGDTVVVNPNSGVGTIIQGNSTVLF